MQSLKPMRSFIVLIEDDPNDILLITRALRKAQVKGKLIVLEDGEKAIKFFSDLLASPFSELPRLVLLDLKLPRMNGFQVLSWVRQQAPLKYLPVVVFTSSALQEDVDRAYAEGANSYLMKPIGHDQMQETIRTVRRYWLQMNLPPSPPAILGSSLSTV